MELRLLLGKNFVAVYFQYRRFLEYCVQTVQKVPRKWSRKTTVEWLLARPRHRVRQAASPSSS